MTCKWILAKKYSSGSSEMKHTPILRTFPVGIPNFYLRSKLGIYPLPFCTKMAFLRMGQNSKNKWYISVHLQIITDMLYNTYPCQKNVCNPQYDNSEMSNTHTLLLHVKTNKFVYIIHTWHISLLCSLYFWTVEWCSLSTASTPLVAIIGTNYAEN